MEKLKVIAMKNTWLLSAFVQHGWGNGYILIPKGHKYHGVHYDDIPVYVHGGLTFSESVESIKEHAHWGNVLPPDINGDEWVIGFDTCHSGDGMEMWPDEKSVLLEAQRLVDQL